MDAGRTVRPYSYEMEGMKGVFMRMLKSKSKMRFKVKFKSLFKNIAEFIRAFIPQRIKNGTVLKTYEFLRSKSSIPPKRIKSNAKANRTVLCSPECHILKPDSYIENQHEWNDVKFGSWKKHNMRYSGCEIIATYNALLALGEKVSGRTMVKLISHYEADGAALNGDFGVSPTAIFDYFENKGYDTEITYSKDETVINKLAESSDTVIATVYNDRMDIMKAVHTVCITKDTDNKYLIHNAYAKDGQGVFVRKGRGGKDEGFDTLQEAAVNVASGSALICAVGISRF
jgi:hypothetical protein